MMASSTPPPASPVLFFLLLLFETLIAGLSPPFIHCAFLYIRDPLT